MRERKRERKREMSGVLEWSLCVRGCTNDVTCPVTEITLPREMIGSKLEAFPIHEVGSVHSNPRTRLPLIESHLKNK